MRIDGFKEILNEIEDYGINHPSYWGCALAGEVGEACNLIKKHERDGLDITDMLPLELADIFNYIVLIARRYNIDLEEAIWKKLDILKKRRKEKLKELFI